METLDNVYGSSNQRTAETNTNTQQVTTTTIEAEVVMALINTTNVLSQWLAVNTNNIVATGFTATSATQYTSTPQYPAGTRLTTNGKKMGRPFKNYPTI